MLDLTLAISHHILVFGLVAMIMNERVLLRASSIDVSRLARLDAGVGATAMLVLAVGAARVLWGGKGWLFYETNPFFWAKILTFGLIAAISIRPTLLFLSWRKAARATPGFRPSDMDVRRAGRWLGVEAFLLIPLIGFAAAMARWPF